MFHRITQRSLAVSILVWILTPAAVLGCGVERQAVKTLADSDAGKLVHQALDAKISDLVAVDAPTRAILDLHADSRLPIELHTYRVQGYLVGFKREDDEDFHIVIEDLQTPSSGKRAATMIVEMPAPACVIPMFRHDADVLRAQWEERFGKATAKFKNVRRHRIKVEFIGAGFFDFIHGQTGVAKNGIELHPVFAWKEVFFKADGESGEEMADAENEDEMYFCCTN